MLGHLDLLLDAGRVREQVTDDGSTYGVASFALAGTPTHATRRWTLCTSQPRPSIRDRFDLSDRVAVVTGGTRGLGLAIARGFAQAGAEVVVVSRKADACDEVAAALRADGGRASAHACHVGHWEELDGLVEDVYRDFGRVDVLVNNAGVSPLYERAQRRHRGALRQGRSPST